MSRPPLTSRLAIMYYIVCISTILLAFIIVSHGVYSKLTPTSFSVISQPKHAQIELTQCLHTVLLPFTTPNYPLPRLLQNPMRGSIQNGCVIGLEYKQKHKYWKARFDRENVRMMLGGSIDEYCQEKCVHGKDLAISDKGKVQFKVDQLCLAGCHEAGMSAPLIELD